MAAKGKLKRATHLIRRPRQAGADSVRYDRKGWELIERRLLGAHRELRLAVELLHTLQRRK